MHKLVFANNKGGVGKTTSAINTGGMLAEAGYKVLLIDLDPQSNLTIGLAGFGTGPENHIGKLLEGEMKASDVIVELTPNLHIIPASPELVASEREVDKKSLRKHEILRMRLNDTNGYDFAILDTQPDIDALLTINGLVYADCVIIPTEPAHFSTAGISRLLLTIGQIRSESLNPFLQVLGYLITFMESTKICREYSGMLESLSPGQVFKTRIRKNTALAASAKKGKPIADRSSSGYLDYRSFSEELLARFSSEL